MEVSSVIYLHATFTNPLLPSNNEPLQPNHKQFVFLLNNLLVFILLSVLKDTYSKIFCTLKGQMYFLTLKFHHIFITTFITWKLH